MYVNYSIFIIVVIIIIICITRTKYVRMRNKYMMLNPLYNVVYIIDGKTDLLGAFTNHLLFARFLAEYHNLKLAFSNTTDLNNISGFENQKKEISNYTKVSNDKKEDHIKNRKLIASSLITYNNSISSNTNKLGDTMNIQKVLLKIGIDKVINNDSIKNIRQDLLRVLPKTNLNTSKLIAIHFRSGEIIKMKNRYIHSKEYLHLLQKLKKVYPNHRIIIFTGTLPPKTHDDLITFKGLEIYSNKPNTLETWRIFIEADVFVMGRSSYSYCPAILRYSSQPTYYKKFWHPKLKSWKNW